MWQKLKSEFKLWRVRVLPGITVLAVVVVARLTGSLQPLEWAAFDQLLRLRPPEPIDNRLVIIGIDESDIQTLGRYPIPDRELAALIKKLQTYHPKAIGLDLFRDLPVEPGHAELTAVFRSSKNLIGIEQASPNAANQVRAKAPPTLPPEQIGFADSSADPDGYVRRMLLGIQTEQGDGKFSLALRLVEVYLADQGLVLDNGIQDPVTMRFGETELPRFEPDFGGYIAADAADHQILVNFRNGNAPFRILSLRQVKTGQVDPNWIRDRIVLIGITAQSARDVSISVAAPTAKAGLVYGVEMHAHTVSQILSAVLEGRPLLRSWAEPWEYLWIVAWGLVGLGVGQWVKSSWQILLLVSGLSLGLGAVSYGLLISGWWVPLVPALVVLMLNAAGPTAVLFYRHEQDLRTRLKERQFILEQTFNTIQLQPMQTLAQMLRDAKLQANAADKLDRTLANPSDDLTCPLNDYLTDLQQLEQELRAVYETVQRETLSQGNSLRLNSRLDLDLTAPLHETLYEVYCTTLDRKREFPHFQTIKVNVVQFDPLESDRLSLEQKRGLCRFLEEAVCNVGKYAIGVTRLTVTCTQHDRQQILRISDNGAGMSLPELHAAQAQVTPAAVSRAKTGGYGTQQAKNLAKQLGGKFRRYPNYPQGTICELTWTVRRFWFG